MQISQLIKSRKKVKQISSSLLTISIHSAAPSLTFNHRIEIRSDEFEEMKFSPLVIEIFLLFEFEMKLLDDMARLSMLSISKQNIAFL
jgi:hypothetical protein